MHSALGEVRRLADTDSAPLTFGIPSLPYGGVKDSAFDYHERLELNLPEEAEEAE